MQTTVKHELALELTHFLQR